MTTLEQLCKALGWQGGTIHEALAEVRRLRAYEVEANTYHKKASGALELSGRMAVAVSCTERSNVRTLSTNMEALSKALQEYDTYIIKWSQEK